METRFHRANSKNIAYCKTRRALQSRHYYCARVALALVVSALKSYVLL